MDGETIFIDSPIELELEGDLVRAKVRSGIRTITFVFTMHNFLASFQIADLTVKEWRAKVAIAELDTVVQFRRH